MTLDPAILPTESPAFGGFFMRCFALKPPRLAAIDPAAPE